jgi:CHASE3 domain sensor protein
MKIGLDFPERYYPRSFLSLLLLAFALVATPLIVAFYNAAVYVEQLAGHSQAAVSQAAQASRGSRLLVEQATALERVVRQYLILGDEDLLNDYNGLRTTPRRTRVGFFSRSMNCSCAN